MESNPDRHKTPVSLKEVKGSTTNLVQYTRVLEYSLCDTHIRILPSIKHGKESHSAVDSHKATENQALLVSKHPAKCRYSNTRGERHTS